jgi:hypothetical protein
MKMAKCRTRYTNPVTIKEKLKMELLIALGGFVALFAMWVIAPKYLVKKAE